jgi:hypothetical protein
MPMTNEAYYINVHSNVFTKETSDYSVMMKEIRIQLLEAHELIAEVYAADFNLRICTKTIRYKQLDYYEYQGGRVCVNFNSDEKQIISL